MIEPSEAEMIAANLWDPMSRTCPDCGRYESVNHTEFEDIGWMKRSGDPDDCGWKDCS